VKKIAIIGSTSHVAKNLIEYFNKEHQHIDLYSRSLNNLDILPNGYDCIINCILAKVTEPLYFETSEHFDNLILDYLQLNTDCLYINCSSGVVHEIRKCDVDNLREEHYAMVSKLNSEMKHAAHKNLNVIDLRFYSFFSRFTNLEAPYFMNEIIKSVINKETFITTKKNFSRDYINPLDLYNIIKYLIAVQKIRGHFEIGSTQPTSKDAIINYFIKDYNLKIKYVDKIDFKGYTASKINYFPKERTLPSLVKYSSLDTIKEESRVILAKFMEK
jgi:hypothetical protein